MDNLSRFSIICLLFAGVGVAFEPPGPELRRKAIGPTEALPELVKRSLEPQGQFEPIPVPGPDDWLTDHGETGQTFEGFLASKPNTPDKVRNIIYLQPLGDFLPKQSPSLVKLREFAADYFQMIVKTLPPLSETEHRFTSRLNPRTHNRQVLTVDILSFLQNRVPPDAFCVLAITMVDLYPDPKWNFVFGQASLRERVGVYSFARYDPAFYGRRREKDYQETLLRRSCKVLVHETGHVFGVAHCIYFSCIMNGSNHLGESDRRPFHLCPVCLHKLYHSIGFDVLKREEDLLRFYKQNQFKDEARWTSDRLAKIRAGLRK